MPLNRDPCRNPLAATEPLGIGHWALLWPRRGACCVLRRLPHRKVVAFRLSYWLCLMPALDECTRIISSSPGMLLGNGAVFGWVAHRCHRGGAGAGVEKSGEGTCLPGPWAIPMHRKALSTYREETASTYHQISSSPPYSPSYYATPFILLLAHTATSPRHPVRCRCRKPLDNDGIPTSLMLSISTARAENPTLPDQASNSSTRLARRLHIWSSMWLPDLRTVRKPTGS